MLDPTLKRRLTERPVKRVLVMLEYGDDQPDNGDYTASVVKLKSNVAWNAMINFQSGHDAAYLDDAINASLPDSPATEDLRKKLKKLRKKVEEVEGDIQIEKLRHAATVRHQHPIARVTQQTPALAQVAAETQPLNSQLSS